MLCQRYLKFKYMSLDQLLLIMAVSYLPSLWYWNTVKVGRAVLLPTFCSSPVVGLLGWIVSELFA